MSLSILIVAKKKFAESWAELSKDWLDSMKAQLIMFYKKTDFVTRILHTQLMLHLALFDMSAGVLWKFCAI